MLRSLKSGTVTRLLVKTLSLSCSASLGIRKRRRSTGKRAAGPSTSWGNSARRPSAKKNSGRAGPTRRPTWPIRKLSVWSSGHCSFSPLGIFSWTRGGHLSNEYHDLGFCNCADQKLVYRSAIRMPDDAGSRRHRVPHFGALEWPRDERAHACRRTTRDTGHLTVRVGSLQL